MATITPSQGSTHAAILGIGAYRPTRVVPNAEVVDAIDSSDEWIQQRSGIKSRRWAGAEESVQMMSVEASRIALAMGESSLTGFQAWLESGPPGPAQEL